MLKRPSAWRRQSLRRRRDYEKADSDRDASSRSDARGLKSAGQEEYRRLRTDASDKNDKDTEENTLRELTAGELNTQTSNVDFTTPAKETWSKEDPLLGQIDAFRRKAKELQSLMAERQTQVDELSAVMAEREGQAQQLETIVQQRQRKADRITEEVAAKLDELNRQVDRKLSAMQQTLGEEAKEQDKKLSESVDKLLTQVEGMCEQLEKLPEDVIDSVEAELDDLSTGLDELSEKVHTESVQNYRNTADLLQELSAKLESMEHLHRAIRSTRGVAIGALVFGILDLVALIAGFAAYFLHLF